MIGANCELVERVTLSARTKGYRAARRSLTGLPKAALGRYRPKSVLYSASRHRLLLIQMLSMTTKARQIIYWSAATLLMPVGLYSAMGFLQAGSIYFGERAANNSRIWGSLTVFSLLGSILCGLYAIRLSRAGWLSKVLAERCMFFRHELTLQCWCSFGKRCSKLSIDLRTIPGATRRFHSESELLREPAARPGWENSTAAGVTAI